MGIRPRADGVTRLGRIPAEVRVGKATSAIAKGDSGPVQFYGGLVADELTATNEDEVQAYVRMGSGVADEAWVYVQRFPWGYEIIGSDCP